MPGPLCAPAQVLGLALCTPSAPPCAAFPPKWFPGLLRATFKLAQHGLAVGAGYAAYVGAVSPRRAGPVRRCQKDARAC